MRNAHHADLQHNKDAIANEMTYAQQTRYTYANFASLRTRNRVNLRTYRAVSSLQITSWKLG